MKMQRRSRSQERQLPFLIQPKSMYHRNYNLKLRKLPSKSSNFKRSNLPNPFKKSHLSENMRMQLAVTLLPVKKSRKTNRFSRNVHFHLCPSTMIMTRMPFPITVKIVRKQTAFHFHAMNVFVAHIVAQLVLSNTSPYIALNVPAIKRIYG